jgi:hypothetical protein
MTKYNIEGDIDFFSELYKSLDIEESEEKTDEDNNLCLISNKPLDDKCVKLICGHSFNYIPLYLDIKNHKQKYNNMEGTSGRLAANEIRCPYCRKKQTGLLPYYEDLGLTQLHGVNYIDPCAYNKNSFSNYKPCEFLTPNLVFDPNGENPTEISDKNQKSGNFKFFKCYHSGTQINYYNGILQGENYGDNKHYCWNHKKQIIKKYKKDIVDKAKDEAKKAKLKEKEDAKKAKDEAK